MKWNDALRIAFTKFRTRTLRNVLVACSLAIGIVMIVGLLSGTNGVLQLGKTLLADSLQGRYFAIETVTPEQGESLELTPVAVDTALYEKEQKEKHGASQLFVGRSLFTMNGGFGVDAVPVSDQKTPFTAQLGTSEEVFVKDFLDPSFSWNTSTTDEQAKPIPALVPINLLLSKEADHYSLGAQQKFELMQKVRAEYLGKEMEITSIQLDESTGKPSKEEAIGARIVVAGFVTEGIFFANAVSPNAIIVPNWAGQQEPFKELLAPAEVRLISEFSNKEALNSYIEEQMNALMGAGFQVALEGGTPREHAAISSGNLSQYVEPLQGRYESFVEIIRIFRNILLGIAGFLLTIAALMLMTTIGKIAADSRKEIGVYRAIGAQGYDIQKIFFSYVFVLVLLAVVIGIVVGLLIDVAVSLKWGDDAFYQMAQFATSVNIEKPALLFLGITPLHVLGVFGGAMLLGILASIIPVIRASRIDPITALREE